ncbi:MAG: hypothetical protein DRJ03_28260 [Chloroflexi bacterium]|nr:MAG: hypothetical protein B6I35_06295 [Anaerolineaceae bacterium 4572_32.2]RLC76640.1 MAG: hypothetical protein DRJ03_28260 [Chloroflexota bacterium]RLC80433.1 MAG: hypothetical protein DRI81_04150 [Chloroflexota bacterium]HEY71896.1 hypothetical protein [Thermoflexia bacterium]
MKRKGVKREYVHRELNQEVTAIGGRYALVKEARLPFRGREVLYLVGYGVFDTACCGVGGCAYARVTGFVQEWKCETNEDGLAVSFVEPIRDEIIQKEVRQLIKERETVQQIEF